MASNPRVEELRKKFDENPRRYFAPLANEYRKAGDFAQAIAICREYLPQQPGHMSGHIVFGQALYEARQFDEAKTVFETALSLDPENLIALKHLGDIELIAGKTDAARAWYQKILDADPRNEEILAQLAKLEQKKAGAKVGATMVMQAVPRPGTAPKAPSAPKPVAPTAPPTPPSQSAPTPIVTPAVKAPAPAAPAAPSPAPAAPVVTADSPTQEIRLDTIPTHAPPTPPAAVEPALGLEPTSMGGDVEPQSFSSSPTIEIDSPVSASREVPPVDSFSLEGLETTSLTADAPAATAPPLPAPPVAEAPAEGLVDLDISIPAAPAPAPPAPPAAAAPAETVELDFAAAPAPAAPAAPAEHEADAEPAAAEAIDLDFAAPAAPTPAPVAEASAPAASDDLPLLDLGGGDTAVPATAPAAPVVEAAAPTPEPPVIDFIPPAAEPPAPEPIAQEEIAPSGATATDRSSAFVTETMAELYLKQGHKEEALKVYRALLEKRPGDAGLQAKIASLLPPPAPAPRTGPSIREMLHLIAMRRPGHRPVAPGSRGAAAAHAATVGPDGLSHLFGGAQVSPADDAAATALATAFAQQNGHEPIAGAPARQAAGDLSLSAVFSAENPAPPPPPSNFSFDQFFSRRATAEHDARPSAEQATESREDVAQFSQWLEGLKQK